MGNRRFTIFISHPSDYLTDNESHGDGLAAYEFISRLAKKGHKLHVAVSNYNLNGKLHDNIKLHQIKLSSKFSIFKSPEYIFKVRKLLKELRRYHSVDIIHQLNHVKPGLSIFLTYNRIPTVLGLFIPYWPENSEQHKIGISKFRKIINSVVECILIECDRLQQKNSSALILSTPAAVSRIYEPKLVKHKFHFLPYGIDTDHFSPDPELEKISNKNLSILFIGRLDVQKGIYTLLDAFQKVNIMHPTCKLHIAGSGPLLKDIEYKISQMPCNESILLLGHVARSEIPKVINKCSVFCTPSYGEPFGLVALEAMSCGKPIVGTNTGGLAHLITDKGGIKVNPKDSQSLADALIEILSNKSKRIKMGKYNRELVERTYSWDIVIDNIESIYREIIDKSLS